MSLGFSKFASDEDRDVSIAEHCIFYTDRLRVAQSTFFLLPLSHLKSSHLLRLPLAAPW